MVKKYVSDYLSNKYDTTPEKVYLVERRKAISKIPVYVAKTANGLNVHSELENHRGDTVAVCPICHQHEDWLHVVKCCSSSVNKKVLIQELEEEEKEQYEEGRASIVVSDIKRFFYTENYNVRRTKMIF